MAGTPKFKPPREAGKLKSNIKKLEREREKLFPVLGRAAYDAFLAGDISAPPVKDACEKIRSLDGQIESWRAEIERLEQEARLAAAQAAPAAQATGSRCPACGAAVSAGMSFCGNCGNPVTSGIQADLCPQCGGPVSRGMSFCGECGARLSGAAPAPAAPAPPAPPGPAQASAPAPPGPAPAPPSQPVAEGEAAAGASRKCASCGAEVSERDAVFCGECGTKL